jgi:hypothetical protein
MALCKKNNEATVHVVPDHEHEGPPLKRLKSSISSEDMALALLSLSSSMPSGASQSFPVQKRTLLLPPVALHVVEYNWSHCPSNEGQGVVVSDDEGDEIGKRELVCCKRSKPQNIHSSSLSLFKPLAMQPQVLSLQMERRHDTFVCRPLPSPPRLPTIRLRAAYSVVQERSSETQWQATLRRKSLQKSL